MALWDCCGTVAHIVTSQSSWFMITSLDHLMYLDHIILFADWDSHVIGRVEVYRRVMISAGSLDNVG